MFIKSYLAVFLLSAILANATAVPRSPKSEDAQLNDVVNQLDNDGVLEQLDHISGEHLKEKMEKMHLDGLVNPVPGNADDKYTKLEQKINASPKKHSKAVDRLKDEKKKLAVAAIHTTTVFKNNKAIQTLVTSSGAPGKTITLAPSGTTTAFGGNTYTIAANHNGNGALGLSVPAVLQVSAILGAIMGGAMLVL